MDFKKSWIVPATHRRLLSKFGYARTTRYPYVYNIIKPQIGLDHSIQNKYGIICYFAPINDPVYIEKPCEQVESSRAQMNMGHGFCMHIWLFWADMVLGISYVIYYFMVFAYISDG